MTDSTSPGFFRISNGYGIAPTNGRIRKPVKVTTSGSSPSLRIAFCGTPISSSVSRIAVSQGEASSRASIPPGKEIWPLWFSTASLRFVKSVQSSRSLT